MTYAVVIKNSAKPDLEKLWDSYLKQRFLEIVETLKNDPYAPTDSFEKLLPYQRGLYSRRLNHQHRIVYRVDEREKQVEIFAVWSHY
jgi:Txe/YoeB family toxin of toxin-antitoxin system